MVGKTTFCAITMEVLTIAWLIMIVGILMAAVVKIFKDELPYFIQDLVVYGKTRRQDESSRMLQLWLLVPKRWFVHFYIIGLMSSSSLMVVLIQVITKETTFFVVQQLHKYIRTGSMSNADCFSVVLTCFLINVQTSRRLYECLWVSSMSGKMHVGHYILGICFYALVNLTIFAEIPLQNMEGYCGSHVQVLGQLSMTQTTGVLLFLWASYHQYKCHNILASLTSWTSKNKKIYKIPYGDWFNYVSSPHYLAEILIYIALLMTMNGHCTLWSLTLTFVVGNLTISAHTTHEWYKQKFEDYPSKRYIVYPYIF